MTTIELGEIGTDAPARPAAPRFDRRLGIAAAVLMCLLTGAGSTIPDPLVRPLWSAPFEDSDNSALSGDTAYVSHATVNGNRLTAYDLATGRVRWDTVFDGELGDAQLRGSDGLILLPAGHRTVPPDPKSDDSAYVEYVTATVVVDAATGREVGRLPGSAQTLYHGTALMNDFSDNGALAGLRLVRLSDQRTIWSVRIADLYTQTLTLDGDRPDRVVTVRENGLVDVYRYTDGTRLAGGRVAWVAPRPDQGQFNDVSAAGDYLTVNSNRRAGAYLHVYRLDTLAEVWQAENLGGWVFPCGTALCLGDESGLVAYDPATGHRRWRRSGVTGSGAVADNRVIVNTDSRALLLDAATGQQVGDAGEGTTVWTVDPSGALYLMRRTRSPGDLTSITRWDLVTGQTDLLGAVDPVPGDRCTVAGRYLGCVAGRAYEVTRVG
jgi:outer membrane protein assembly factor BamB